MDNLEREGRWLLMGYSLLMQASPIPDSILPRTDPTKEQFRQALSITHHAPIESFLLSQFIPWLQARFPTPLPVFSSAEIQLVIAESINDTNDMLDTVRDSSLTAAFPFDQWRSVAHQAQVLRDLARKAADRLLALLRPQEQPQFTGRMMWKTTHSDSRHAALDGNITTDTWAFKNEHISGPRHNPHNPHEWSGCSCYIVYEYEDGRWL